MLEDKFAKAFCGVNDQYYGLKIRGEGSAAQVVDFYDIPSEDAVKLASNIDAQQVTSADNLRPCFQCGQRKAASCSCARPLYHCEKGMGYRFQCLYCRELRLFTVAEGSEAAGEGEVGRSIRLAQGQEVVISAVGAQALEHIKVGVGWEKARSGPFFDLDSSVFVFSPSKLEVETIYFNNLKHESGCVIHGGDNLVGGKMAGGEGDDSESIDIYLKKVPANRSELYFVLNIYQASERRQSMDKVNSMYIRLTDVKTGRLLVEYTYSGALKNQTALIIGKAYRKGEQWVFKAIGQGLKTNTIKEIIPHCTM